MFETVPLIYNYLRIWKTLISMWTNVDHNKELVTGQMRDSDRDCLILNKTINLPDEQLRAQMMKVSLLKILKHNSHWLSSLEFKR